MASVVTSNFPLFSSIVINCMALPLGSGFTYDSNIGVFSVIFELYNIEKSLSSIFSDRRLLHHGDSLPQSLSFQAFEQLLIIQGLQVVLRNPCIICILTVFLVIF